MLRNVLTRPLEMFADCAVNVHENSCKDQTTVCPRLNKTIVRIYHFSLITVRCAFSYLEKNSFS